MSLSSRVIVVISEMEARSRVERARIKIKKVADRISALLLVAEQNALIVYSPQLAGQIPPSSAGHAFNSFQRAMHGYEIVQLCSFWDMPRAELAENGIPTVFALIDDDDVVRELCDDVRNLWKTRPTRIYQDEANPIEEGVLERIVDQSNERYGDAEAGKALAELTRIRKVIADTLASPILASVKNMRDRYLAHALDQTFAEKRGEVAPMKYGDEKALLDITTDAIETLYLWVSGTNFDIAESRQRQAKYAHALWDHCNFTVSPRS